MNKFIIIFCCIILSLVGFSAQNSELKSFSGIRSEANRSASDALVNSSGSSPTFSNKGPRTPKATSARRYTKRKSYSSTYSHRKSKSTVHSGVTRDKNGRIKRSSSEKRAFMKQSGFPKGRPGYVVDHIVPLKKGGCDCPSNMQWQTIQAAKEKDQWE